MYGLIDISHRFRFSNASASSSVLSTNDGDNYERTKNVQSHLTKLLFSYFNSRKFLSIEDYTTHFTKTCDVVKNDLGSNSDFNDIRLFHVFDTFYYWSSVNSAEDTGQIISNFVDRRNKLFGDVFEKLGTQIRDVDEKNLDLPEFCNAIQNIFAIDDVIIWRYNPTTQFMAQAASTTPVKANADIHQGIIGEAVKNERSIYYPNIRNIPNYINLIQHQETFKSRQWKGAIVCPLHFSKNLVGAIGLYSKHDLIFSKVETSLILYMLANLSKRISRDVFGSSGEKNQESSLSFDKLMRLAPTIYVGTKTTYRLHSIKNKIRTTADVLKHLKPHIKNKSTKGEDWRSKCFAAQKETMEVFKELESCLLIGSNRSQKLYKEYPVKILVDRIRGMLVNYVSNTDIEKKLSSEYYKNAKLFADIVSLEQAIYNIIENSFHFLSNDYLGKRRPILTVEIVQSKAALEIKITDNALGMSEEEQDNAKTIYYSGDRKKGSGVGLWMSERILNEHSGELNIESNSNGTVCNLTLPLSYKGPNSDIVKQNINLHITGGNNE